MLIVIISKWWDTSKFSSLKYIFLLPLGQVYFIEEYYLETLTVKQFETAF